MNERMNGTTTDNNNNNKIKEKRTRITEDVAQGAPMISHASDSLEILS